MDCHAKIAGFPTGEIEDHLQKSRATFLWPDNVTPRSDYVLKQAQVSKYIPILPGLPHQFARRNHQNQLKQTIKPRSHFFRIAKVQLLQHLLRGAAQLTLRRQRQRHGRRQGGALAVAQQRRQGSGGQGEVDAAGAVPRMFLDVTTCSGDFTSGT